MAIKKSLKKGDVHILLTWKCDLTILPIHHNILHMKYLYFFVSLMLISCGDPRKVIKIKGSDTEVNLAVNLAEHFNKVNSEFSVTISGGGSGLGIASLMNGQADIANSSRPLTQEEESLFKKRKIDIKTVIFAEDATAFIVHNTYPVDTIDVATLASILSGDYPDWKLLTGQQLRVTIYGRQSNSGTHSFVQKKLKINFSRNAKEMNGNAQILEAVKMDPSAIGYVGAGYIARGVNANNTSIKILRISEKPGSPAVSPLDEKAILQHQYFFQRPLYQFIPAGSWNKVQPFIQYELSAMGKRLIQKEGYYIIQ